MAKFALYRLWQRCREVLPIPLFNPKDKQHLDLAQLSRVCHKKVAQFVANADEKTLTQPIGRLRQQVRAMLTNELSQINRLVAKLLFNYLVAMLLVNRLVAELLGLLP